jgi:uncharacterized membrane protein YdjX (TVP38/TMEM64 family)
MATQFIFRGLVVIVVLVLVSYLLGDVLDQAWIDTHVRERGVPGGLLFVVAGWLLASAGLSRQVIAFLSGYGFGFLPGVLLAMLAVVAVIDENTFTMAVVIRLLPLGSNWMVNIAAGASGVRSVPFFLGSALGYIPQMLIFALVGSGTRVDQFWQVAIAMAMLVVAVVLGVWLYRKYRHGKALDPQLDHQLGIDDTPADR